ncbi:Plant intracellular Ras-group-related LRR protein 7 [Gracilariopsis chorda]|uniref:Plant intracellular Ras-group-related LRR protein 7 n=1 Tax=Gracilariopsis chorda TaxID=448386 RepID=A0A2V3IN36_9FLOR|nr:Plant intracellular Ras-group-related LRR protein 7 [Gracilariopsis chorda]|eukprot:PXF43496.1 Plant intracellular Ras-group-related LRR protein 7 [Gracilariopsis chorda]
MGASASKTAANTARNSNSDASAVAPADDSLQDPPQCESDEHQPQPPPPTASLVELPGKKQVEDLKFHNPVDDGTNQTGLSVYEMRIQDSFYSTPARPKSKAYTAAKEAAAAKKAARAERKAQRARKKSASKMPEEEQLVPHTVDWAIHNTKKLGVLNLSKMDLTVIPDLVFDSMPGTLRIINISFNRFESLDPRLCDYVLVQRLIANGNFLSSLPSVICRMTALKKLDLARNKLTSLPDAFGAMRFLEHVDLSHNLLNELPPSFASLDLTSLNLSRNKFTIAPLEIASMHMLLDLDLSYNQLIAVPDEYMALRSLIAFTLDSNRISDFPEAILQVCTDLITLRLRANPIKMNVLEVKPAYAEFAERRRIKFKRQIEAGSVSIEDLNPADSN